MYINLHVIIIAPIKDKRLMHFFLYVGEHLIDLPNVFFDGEFKMLKKKLMLVTHSWDYRVQINETDA